MWNALYKRLWIVIFLPLLAAGVAYLLTARKAGQYKSTAVIEASIPDVSPESKTLKDIQQPDEYYENMVETMKTEVITSMASYRLLLHDLETEIAFRPPAIQFSDERKAAIRRILEKKLWSFQLLSETVPAEATINQVIHNMDYNIGRWVRDGEMTVQRKATAGTEIDVATVTEDPFLSAFASNSLAQEYIRYENSILAPAPTSDSVGYYRQEVDRLRKKLEAKTGELNEARSRTKTSTAGDTGFRRAKANRISEYEMKIKEEEWEISSLRDQLAKLQRETPQPQQQLSKDVAASSKIQAIRNKIDQLSGIYAQGGSKDKKLDSIINVLRKQLNDETTRLQMASRSTAATETSGDRERDMIQSRIQRHEENIESLRRDIRKVRNTTIPATNDNRDAIAQLTTEQDQANKEYNAALLRLKVLEGKAGNGRGVQSRERHHLVLKEKALPSAEPESPYAMLIVLSVYLGTLLLCVIIIAANRPAPSPYDDIFLRVNYSNRRANKKSTPVTEGG
jgi:DNA repair exonuclease SbcCD ATPase subunit